MEMASMNDPALLTPAEQQILLALARTELRSFFGLLAEDEAGVTSVDGLPAALRRPAGTFVSLHAHGKLRGCIGTFTAAQPLAQAVRELVIAAATRDPRFSSVTAEDVEDLELEISVLSEPAPLTHVAQVNPGRHGLIVARDACRGLLLPQVAVEQGWDAPTFLSQTCVKAGLPADAWYAWDKGEDDDFSVLAFTAQVFSECDGSSPQTARA
jgi:AmmeMemoRadiSam system protein A